MIQQIISLLNSKSFTDFKKYVDSLTPPELATFYEQINYVDKDVDCAEIKKLMDFDLATWAKNHPIIVALIEREFK